MTDSLLGIHVCNWSFEAERHAHCQPTVFKSIEHNAEKLARFKATSPGTLTVGRVVMDGFDGRADYVSPHFAAHAVADIILAGLNGCRYHVLEGTNEPIINNEDQAKRICEFNIHLARIIQAEGFDFAAYSWGGTRPDIEYTRYLEPALKEARWLAMHAYGPGPLFHEPYWFLLNYRLFWNALSDETKQGLKGLLLTEFGIAKGLLHTDKDVGWLSDIGPKIEPRHYGGDLVLADKQLDCYVKGATIYQTGDLYGKWRTFEIKQLLPGLEAHIRSFVRPTPNTPDPPNKEEEMEQQIRVLVGGKVYPMELEEYLKGVVPQEMPPSWPMEALKAQAVAARCYAMRKIQYPKHDGHADLCATECCQVWESDYYAAATQAVRETKGVVAEYNGEVINALYSGHCGGFTINNEEAWKGTAVPYLRGVECIAKGKRWGKQWYGHRVGMCQWGAHDMAEQGATYKEILWHYYVGCEVDGERAPPEIDYLEIVEEAQAACRKAAKEAYNNALKAQVNLLEYRKGRKT